ncbi:MAG: DUF4974 domain-containing protein [Paramuribaculum sp.]|nr:DUF4974 domain-containing protein [Paramuribaculum sp.]
MNSKPYDFHDAGVYDTVLDMIEHPESYTAGQLEEILANPEAREMYNLLSKTDSALKANEEIDVNAEWKRFSLKYSLRPRRWLMWAGSRAASVAAVICTSIVAVAAGIAVTVAVVERSKDSKAETQEQVLAASAVAPSANTVIPEDTVNTVAAPVMFENETLEVIMDKVAAAYSVEIKFNNKEAAGLHLYYKFDPSLTLDEIVSQLNTFERINIRLNGNSLTID